MPSPVLLNGIAETTTTTGTGTLTLAGAKTGYSSFSGVGDGNTCYYVIRHQSADEWEYGIGTYTASGTTLARTTVLGGSNGTSAETLSAGTKDVFISPLVQHLQLNDVDGTDAAVAMVVGQNYNVDMSAWATADRAYTLPTTANVGDRIGVTVTSGNATYTLKLMTTAASNDTIAGVDADTTPWSRLFITGESVVFRCVVADTDWVVERDNRIPQTAGAYLANDSVGDALHNTSSKVNYDTEIWDVGDILALGEVTTPTACVITLRRAGRYFITAACSCAVIDGGVAVSQIATNEGTPTVHFQGPNSKAGGAGNISAPGSGFLNVTESDLGTTTAQVLGLIYQNTGITRDQLGNQQASFIHCTEVL